MDINFIDTKAKYRHLKNWSVKGLCGRCLSKFIDWRYSQSCWYFRPSLWTVAPLTFSLVQLSPPLLPLLCVNKYTVCTYTVCKGGGYGVLRPREINNCRKVPIHVKIIFRLRHFALSSMSLILIRFRLLQFKFRVRHSLSSLGCRGEGGECCSHRGAVILTFFHILRYNHPSLTP